VNVAQPEFSRPVRIDTIGTAPRALTVEADEAERAALAGRFELVSVEHLSAEIEIVRKGDAIRASGRLTAKVVQSCVASGEPVEEEVCEPFEILFCPEPSSAAADDEVELAEEDCDVVFYSGSSVDVGEAVAESLSLALNPWPRSPRAEAALKEAGVKSEDEAKAEASPFAGLAGLKDKLGK